MPASRTILRLIMGVVTLYLSACTLSTAPRQATIAPTQPIISIPTSPPLATSTPLPTFTPLPTSTSIPLPTSTPVYTVYHPLPGPVCSVSPNVAGANIRSGPGTNFPIIGVLPAANWLTALRLDGNGWYQISYPGTPVEGGWMSGTVVVLQQPCVCGPNNCVAVNTPFPTFTPQPQATATFPPDQCILTMLNAGDSVLAYAQPTTDRAIDFSLVPSQRLTVVGRTNDGWYGVIRGNLQAAYIGIYTLAWIRSDARITLTGAPCGQLKVIDLSYPAPTGCMVSPANVSSIPVYSQYDFSIPTSGTLSSGTSASVVGKSPAGVGGVANGWYAIDPAIAQAGNVGKYRLRWVPIDNTVQTSGDCTALPTISLEPF